MEIIGKVSKGSKMDQIYIPKNRHGFPVGEYVLITPASQAEMRKPYFYGIKKLEPIKLVIINEAFAFLEKKINCENLIVTGSFVEEGFCFNDLDILIITGNKLNTSSIEKEIEAMTGIEPHIIIMDNKSLIQGLSTDPLYQSMLSKCVSKKRLIYNIKSVINYKLLDLHLLKSKILLDNFDVLSGNEKYHHLQNVIAICLFLKSGKVTKDLIDNKIKEIFGISKFQIKQNLIEKREFANKYKKIYDETFEKIMKNIKNGTK